MLDEAVESTTQPETVIDHIEAAIAAAERDNMSASEVIGLLFYYAHNVAQEARESALGAPA